VYLEGWSKYFLGVSGIFSISPLSPPWLAPEITPYSSTLHSINHGPGALPESWLLGYYRFQYINFTHYLHSFSATLKPGVKLEEELGMILFDESNIRI